MKSFILLSVVCRAHLQLVKVKPTVFLDDEVNGFSFSLSVFFFFFYLYFSLVPFLLSGLYGVPNTIETTRNAEQWWRGWLFCKRKCLFECELNGL